MHNDLPSCNTSGQHKVNHSVIENLDMKLFHFADALRISLLRLHTSSRTALTGLFVLGSLDREEVSDGRIHKNGQTKKCCNIFAACHCSDNMNHRFTKVFL